MKNEKLELNILIVEDEEEILLQLVKMLSRRVNKVYSAKNGLEAYEIYKKQSLDLILSDIDMPVMDGLELLKKVREKDADLSFILSTGLKNLDALATAIEYGITSFLPKPVYKELLIKKLEDVAFSIQSRKKVEELSKLKEEFLANMSHEIRTPMNTILGFTKLLMQTELNEKQSKYLQAIDESTTSLLGIVNDILDFSKLQAKKMELDLMDVDFLEQMQKIAELFIPQFEAKKINFSLEIDPSLKCCVKLDTLRFKQVVYNLLTNAIKFTPQGEKILLYAHYKKEHDGKVLLHVGVKDSGIGISSEQQQHIFDAFSQADSSTTRLYGGTGLGLSISNSLLALMGSSLNLESKEGIGSDFFFELELDVCEILPPKVSLQEQRYSFENFVGAKILIAEDNLLNQAYIAEVLGSYNLEHTIVENGQKALLALQKNSYDIILMDINMPVLCGIATLKKIKELGITTPVVALTANAMQTDKERYLSEGFDEYLAKPIRLDALYNIFSKYLHVRSYIDFEALLEELSMMEGLAQKILNIFLQNYLIYLTNLREAIEKKDFNGIENAAHTLKGSAATIKIEAIREIAFEIEQSAQAKEEIDYMIKYKALEQISQTAHLQIENFLKEYGTKAEHI